MAISHPIPVDVLRQLLRLDPETGRLYWLPRGPEWFATEAARRTWNTRFAGKEAFTARNPKGGRVGGILYRTYQGEHVAFALRNGEWPAKERNDVADVSHPIPIDLLRTLVRLDPQTGKLYWIKRGQEWFPTARAMNTWNSRFAGKEALTAPRESRKGQSGVTCLAGSILGHNYRAHIVAFALANGRWPTMRVDHKDGSPTNNRPENLRECTQAENCLNRRGNRERRSSHYKGVYLHYLARNGKELPRPWCATFMGKHLGMFASEAAAAVAYDVAALGHDPVFSRPNFPIR